MKAKLKDNKNSFWTRWLSVLFGLAMFVGAWLVLAKTSAAFQAVSFILGIIVLIRGLAGMISYFRQRENSRLKEKSKLGWSVFIFIIGLIYLIFPGMMGDAIKWRAAGVFALIAIRSLWALRELKNTYPKLTKFSLVMNIILLALCILMVILPGVSMFILALLIASALVLGGIDLMILSLLPSEI